LKGKKEERRRRKERRKKQNGNGIKKKERRKEGGRERLMCEKVGRIERRGGPYRNSERKKKLQILFK
jgi:hypothetical protein